MKKFFCCAFLLVSLSLWLLSCGGASAPNTGGGGGGGGTGGGGLGQQVPCNSPAGTTCYSLAVNGVMRTYALHVPANFQKNIGALVLVLHGSGGNGLGIESSTGFSTLSDQDGFAVAYPDGLVEPSEGVPDWAYFFNDFTDDVGFFRQFIPTLQANVEPDPKRIFVTGFSAGAFMSHRLGVQASDLIAGIGVAEGAISSTAVQQPVPAALGPVSVVILHGDQDHTVFYCGSQTDASQEDTFNYWTSTSANSCSTLDTQSALCDSQGNITTVVEKDATACSGNTEVKFYKLIGGTHAWNTGPMDVPGNAPYNPDFDSTTGITTRDIVWNFFSTHPKQ
ncbi:MAG TPA: PHB depolymerase family esterase [Candidatus Sulfotelmatobacter sp.]|nr:PHB depolymerase family esterase [Candidatus Sulfotelmatobacter sp.]